MGCCCAKRSKVLPHSDGVVGRIKFKKPINTDPPMEEYDEHYVNRKQAIKERFFTLNSGRRFCFFVDGADPSQSNVSIVFCIHGLFANKNSWILSEPMPNICQIAMDRMGHGKSSSVRELGQYPFADGVPEYAELIDHIYDEMNIPKDKKFFVTGHSMGGAWALQIAASPLLAPRVIAIATICSPFSPHHPSITAKELKSWKLGPDLSPSLGKPGSSGGFTRCFTRCLYNAAVPQGVAGDFGMAGFYDGEIMHDAPSGDAFRKDHFASTAMLDGCVPSCSSVEDAVIDVTRCVGLKWSYDISDITVPCFIYSSESEKDRTVAASIHRIVKVSELINVEGCGHQTIARGYRQIIEALVQSKAVPNFSLKA